MAAPLQRFQLNRYLKNMADRLNAPGLSSAEQDRIRRAVDQGFTNVIYHSTPDDFEDIDLNYTDVGFHAGTPVQATNRALDKAIQAGLQSHRNQGIYIPGTHVLPLAYRPGRSITAGDVGEWKDAYTAAMGLRRVPELGSMQDWLDENIDYLEYAARPYGGTRHPDWLTSMDNLSTLSDIRERLLDRGIRQIEYENTYESEPALMVPEYEEQLMAMTDEARRLYKAGLERRPSSVPPELGASPEAIEAFLQQRPADPLSYLGPEERALYDKYYGDIKRIENSPAAYDPTTSRIFLDPADLRSIYAPFDPSKAGEVGLWKAEGGPVEKAEGGPVFDPSKISSMADELVNPYYEFEPFDHDSDDVQYMAGGGLARQWLKDAVENEVKRFQQTTAGGMDPQQALQQLQQSMQEADFQALPEGTRNAFQRSQEDLQRKAALNAWLGGTATKYIKRDYGTEQDPLTQLQMRHTEGEWPPRAAQGVLGRPPHVMGLYETTASRYTDPRAYGDSLGYNEEVLQSNPWLRNLPADQPIYRAVDVDMLGMPHLVDEIQNAMNPSAGLPRNLQIRPESLQRMSFPQASELVGKINQYRAEQMAAANAQRATNPATQLVKQYPEGYRWVQITPDADIPEGWQRLNSGDYKMPDGSITSRGWAERAVGDALKYEGDTMGHCVGGYCDSVMSGASRIYSLRDAQGMPHVTIEAVPEFHPEEADFDEYWNALKPRLREQGEIPDRNEWFDKYLESTSDFAEQAAKLLGNRQRIIQIKGKGNRAPVDQYVPFVQDFVRAQDWIDVEELDNARLRDATGEFSGRPQPQQRYMTDAEYDDYLLQLLRDEQAPGMKEGGEMKDEKTAMDELEEAWNALRAGFMTQYTPDERGMPGIALSAAALPALPGMLAELAGAGVSMIDPETGLAMMEAGDYVIPEYTKEYDARYAALMDDLLERYGMGSVGDLDAGDRFALAAGEMLGQVPAPGAWLKRLSKFTNKIPRPVRLAGEYFTPTIDPSLAGYAAGTTIGGSLYQLAGPDQVEASPAAAEERMTYRPPAFPGMAEGGPVFNADRINAMAMELMEPQKLAPGGLASARSAAKKAAESAAKAGKLSNAEAGRIAEAVQGELRPTPVVRERGKAVRRQGPGYDIEAIASEYPTTGPGRLNFKNPEKPEGFMEKVLTPEELLLQRARNAAQKDIGLGNYDPLFALEDRYYATPSLYDIEGNTLIDAMPKKQETIDRFLERFDTPEIRSNLLSAYYKGLSPMSEDWYALGQLQDAFIRELGPEEGARQFSRRFADAMAATTGGADPTANLLMAAYVNNRKLQGLQLPVGSPNYPHPIGGRYLSGNMIMADKTLMQMRPLTSADHPKRFNFRANFLGDRDRATIDEQMSSLYEPKLKAPPGASYGIMEGVLGDVARSIGVRPANFQGVGWIGAKGVEGKPMMQHINEAIERTSRVTGRSPEDVLRDSIIRATRPLYAKGGLATYKDMIGA